MLSLVCQLKPKISLSHSQQLGDEARPSELQFLFTSALSEVYYSELESLLFFNPQQRRYRSEIIRSIDSYGRPRIVEERGLLRIAVGTAVIAQTLFCLHHLDKALVGAVVYFRQQPDVLEIVHLAVREDYSASGDNASQYLVMQLIDQVRQIGGRIKGIKRLTVLYSQAKVQNIPVRHC